jgi:outer membrane lipoprotein-sorting protein
MMLVLVLLILGSIGFAQGNGDASSLIRAVSDSAKDTATWQIEGSIKQGNSDASFVLQLQSPDKTRFEQRGGVTPALIVCDSTNAWLYSPPVQCLSKGAPK